jgi:adenylate kinase
VSITAGYPRTLSQATEYWKYCQTHSAETTAIHIDLAIPVVKAKLNGRRLCTTCKQNFNVADVMNDGFCMPAILPALDKCTMGAANCNPVMTTRADDAPEVIDKRIDVYQKETEPLLEYFRSKNSLVQFPVRKGIPDTDDLIKAMGAC